MCQKSILMKFEYKTLCKVKRFFLFRFKAEVEKALESFVEKEDDFIKQVMQNKKVIQK